MTIMILSGVLGFLLASVIALFLAPPLWRQAVKVTTKRLIQQSPRMIDEGHADRDQMRAEFAVTTRKMEVKIEQLKEVSGTRLIELSRTEKKRERLQGKTESLQSALEKRDARIERLNKKGDKLLADIHRKSEQLTNQAERLARQTKMLNTQAATLEKNVIEMEQRKQKINEYVSKEVEFSSVLSKQDLELSKSRTKQQQAKLSHKSENKASRLESERVNQEIDDSHKEIASLTKNLEARKKATDRLRQDAAENKEKINSLIREIHTKDEKITQLNHEIALTNGSDALMNQSQDQEKNPSTNAATESEVVITVADNRQDNDNKRPSTITPLVQMSPQTNLVDNSSSGDHVSDTPEPTANVTQQSHANAHPARSLRKESKTVTTSNEPSLAERIRALQVEQPKSM